MQGLPAVSDYLPFLIIGLTVGSVYGIAAMGLVLTYKTSGVFNLGHGAIAALAAVVFYELRQRQGIPWPIAAALAVVGFGVLAGLAMERLARSLARVPTGQKLVATVGLVVGVRALVNLLYGTAGLRFAPVFPERVAFTVGGVNVSLENVVAVAFGLVAVLALYVFFLRSQLGRAMRGVVDDPDLLDMTGVSPVRVRRWSWLIGSSFAAVSGILLASAQQQLDVTLLSLLVIQAFGAAALGAFTSLPLTYAGGLAVGVLQALLSKEAAGHSSLQGLDLNTPFLVLFVVLLVLPRRKLVELGRTAKVQATATRATTSLQRNGWLLTAGAFLLAPVFWGTHGSSYTVVATQVLLFLSLGLLVRTSGQISLCQIGFAAVGGAAMAHLLRAGVPWGLALVGAMVIAIPVGAIVAIPAIRLSGLYLGLATLGFGVLLAQYAYPKGFFFGSGTPLPTRRPQVLGLDSAAGYYYLVLAVVALGMVLVFTVERSRLGRLLRGLGDSPVAMSTLGSSINVTRLIVFCTSSALAALSGALSSCVFGSVTGDSFNYVNSLVVLAVLAIAGKRTLAAAVVAPVLSVLPLVYLEGDAVAQSLQLLFGIAAIVTAAARPGTLNRFMRTAVKSAEYRSGRGGPAGARRTAPLPSTTRTAPFVAQAELTGTS